ncbi:MAG: hypothetical protein DIU61_006325 [Bacteroidota bacterium]|jgi:hypothetical protein|nr:MAG: hypothetical protein DIU61_10360 [Bacteroidota bacterium]
METIFKEPHLECYYDEDANVMFHVWIKKPSSEQLREGLTRVFNEYTNMKKKKGGNIHWLADTQKIGVVSIDDQGWLEKVWNEMLFVKAGVKTHAVIIGNDVFAKYAMEKFKKTMMERYRDQNLYLATFPSKEEAYAWFKECERANAA